MVLSKVSFQGWSVESIGIGFTTSAALGGVQNLDPVKDLGVTFAYVTPSLAPGVKTILYAILTFPKAG